MARRRNDPPSHPIMSEHCPNADYTKGYEVIAADLETVFEITCMTRADVLDFASGHVPLYVQAQARSLLQMEDDERRLMSQSGKRGEAC